LLSVETCCELTIPLPRVVDRRRCTLRCLATG
jgi:hypothetical protein